MTFRRKKIDPSRKSRAWHDWIDAHRAALISLGLPAAVYLDEEHWRDFLENGHLHWHEDTAPFEFTQLSPPQLTALRRFLEGQHGSEEPCPPLLGWVRVRCGDES